MKRKTLAIPIRCSDYSNSSQVVSLLARDVGLIEGIAKGAYREKGSFQGPFDLAVLREVVYVERRSGLAILTESSVLDGFRGLRTSWRRFVASCHVLEFLRLVTVAGEPVPELFDIAAGTLARVGEAPENEVSALVFHFELRALRVLGFLASIDACVACRRPWPGEARPAIFLPQEGGLLCRRCHRRKYGAVRGRALPGTVVKTLHDLAETSDTGPARAFESPILRQLHGQLFESWTIFLERPFRMLKYRTVWI